MKAYDRMGELLPPLGMQHGNACVLYKEIEMTESKRPPEITVPSRVFKAANSVVVPCRL